MKTVLAVKKFSYFVSSVFVIGFLIAAPLSIALPQNTDALSGADFNPERIIDDAVFTNKNSMTVSEIQAFLNAKVPDCDVNGTQSSGRWNAGANRNYTRAEWGASKGYPAPYTCLKDYRENTGTFANNGANPSTSVPGGKSSAQIIWDAAQAYRINPQVLLVTLQKEQSLITDDWPWENQYDWALGYGCPDTAACSQSYRGFFRQVDHAAWQMRYYLDHPYAYNYWVGNYYVQYNPNANCGGRVINIRNAATAALYIYTPYQPNQAALDNLNGTGNDCSAYGNRNFWRFFNNWFGNSLAVSPYTWDLISSKAYVDNARTRQFNIGKVSLAPGEKAYIRVQARNAGNQTWQKSLIRLGTSGPLDRQSSFADGTWASATRIQMVEDTVSPGGTATFEFSVTAPSQAGGYVERFNLISNGYGWMNDIGFHIPIDVMPKSTAVNNQNIRLNAGGVLRAGQYLLSPDAYTTLNFNRNGNLNLNSDFARVWHNQVDNYDADRLVMQSDGNLVQYSKSNGVLWSSETGGNAGAYLILQADGNMVIYNAGGGAIWESGTPLVPNHYSYVTNGLKSGAVLSGQSLRTINGIRLTVQADGNIVAYNGSNVLWASDTGRQQAPVGNTQARLAVQGDGNMVIYSADGRALWSTGTHSPGAFLRLQADGNLVLYSASGSVLWALR